MLDLSPHVYTERTVEQREPGLDTRKGDKVSGTVYYPRDQKGGSRSRRRLSQAQCLSPRYYRPLYTADLPCLTQAALLLLS